jgi:hypothetical protein
VSHDSSRVVSYGSSRVVSHDSSQVESYDSSQVEIKSELSTVICNGKIFVNKDAAVIVQNTVNAGES